jgi:hypothetical protein
MRNKHHFEKSATELQSMKDTLKSQAQHKKKTMDQGKNVRENMKSECT